MWFYFDHVLVPYQIQDSAVRHQPRGNLSDLYPRWLGSRELLLHGRAQELAGSLGVTRRSVSISHADHYAVVQVVFESDG